MKLIILILLLGVMSFTPLCVYAQKYKHKSETEIARMTPAQRVDEWVNEQVYHRFDLSDVHGDLLRKYVQQDGVKALPRLIETMDEYDPIKFREGKGRRGERFDASVLMLGYIDDFSVRLRASEEGKRAINALERAIERMRAAGYRQKGQHEWAQHGRFDSANGRLKYANGISFVDDAVKDTFRLEYKINLSDAELLEFSNFLVKHYPEYPSWSERNFFRDNMQLNEAGNPLWVFPMKKPERYYEAYSEFKKAKR